MSPRASASVPGDRASAECGAASAAALGVVAVAVALTAIILGAATALQHSGAVARAADLGALVAADTLFGHHGGEPCANARIVVESNGAELISCTIGHDARVVARRQILGIPFTRSARAG